MNLDMCSGPKNKPSPSNFPMAGESRCKFSILLELAASDDVTAFKGEVEGGKGCDIDEPCFWYGRKIGSRKMGFEERTPLMIASMFGSLGVLRYILATGKADVNRASGSDKATALHLAVVGESYDSLEAVKLLLDSSADPSSLDCNGNRPVDLIKSVLKPSIRKSLSLFFKGESFIGEEKLKPTVAIPEKKEYPVDITLPDINEGIYSSDEFRMYTFKVKPCSRAYSHDWTECPFVHPGENARRRDPRKYPYSCVPCPDFRKGVCPLGDSCEYAHGVFESWLHPAQYKTRLCKDEIGCARKVCFFAHKPEELRPVYASTGSALPSPKSFSPPLSPMAGQKGMPGMGLWNSPPPLQLNGSRLKTGLSARDLDLDMELLGLENNNAQLLEEMSRLSSPSFANNDFSRFQMNNGIPHSPVHLQPPMGIQMRPNMAPQVRQSNPMSPSMRNTSSPFGFDSSNAVATAVMNSRSTAAMNPRSAAMTKRSLSFIDRSPATQGPFGSPNPMSKSNLSGWGSPDGKLDWAVRGVELNKLRKSYSFGNRDTSNAVNNRIEMEFAVEPDVSWVNSLVKDSAPQEARGIEKPKQRNSDGMGNNNHGMGIPWGVDPVYIDQEQMVA